MQTSVPRRGLQPIPFDALLILPQLLITRRVTPAACASTKSLGVLEDANNLAAMSG
jgi:hypothetical protein